MIILFLLFLLFIITIYAFNNIILSPRKNKNDAFELLKNRGIIIEEKYNSKELHLISNDNLILKGYHIENNLSNEKIIILIHGYTANHYMSLQFVDFYISLGFDILLLDSRSHGESEGKYATYGIKEKEDIKLWVDYIKNNLYKKPAIGLHGQSMGASTALMYIGTYQDVDFVVADCPYSSGKEILKYQFENIVKIPPYPLYQLVNIMTKLRCGFSMNDVFPIKDIKKSDIPIMFIHGKNDSIIPYNMSLNMYSERNNVNDSILLIDNANHVESYIVSKDEYEKSIVEFLGM